MITAAGMSEMNHIVDGSDGRNLQEQRQSIMGCMEDMMLLELMPLPSGKPEVFRKRILFRTLRDASDFVGPALQSLFYRVSGGLSRLFDEEREFKTNLSFLAKRKKSIDEVLDVDTDSSIPELTSVEDDSR